MVSPIEEKNQYDEKQESGVTEMMRDLLGKERAAFVMDEVGFFIEQWKIIGTKEIRPWSKEFFSVFKPPQWNLKYIETRMVTNLLHYRSNYLVIALTMTIIMILSSPYLLVTILACIGVTMLFTNVLTGQIVIGEHKVTSSEKAYACVATNICLFFVTGSAYRTCEVIMYSIGICGLHMLLRPRSITANSTKLYEQFKLSGWGDVLGLLGGGTGSHSTSGDSLLDMESGAVSDPATTGGADMRKRTK